MAKELLVGLSEEDKREMISFMGLVNAQARNTLQVNDVGRENNMFILNFYASTHRFRGWFPTAAAHERAEREIDDIHW